MDSFSLTRIPSFLKPELSISTSQCKHSRREGRRYVKVGERFSEEVAVARQVLKEIPLSDTFAWNNLIHTHLSNKDPKGALSIYHHMMLHGVRADTRTLPRVLAASRISGRLRLGQQVHGQTVKLGFLKDGYVVTALMEMYGHLDGVDVAKRVFNMSAGRRSSVPWTILAKLYLREGRPDSAIDLLFEMLEVNAPVDEVALVTVIGACGMLKSLQLGKKVHEIARKLKLEFAVLVSNSLLKMYVDCDSIADARETFDQMPTKDVISWTEIVRGHVKNGDFNEALKLFRQMNTDGIKPDSLSISSILPACARAAAHKHGKEIHGYLLRNGIDLNLRIQNSIMDMYAKSGCIEYASQIFAGMLERDVISWTVMILGFSLHGQGEHGVTLFRSMENDPSVEVDQFAYAAVLHSCATACLVEEGKFYFSCIKEPKIIHYALMVSLLARSALFGEANSLIDQHQIGRHVEVWRALLDGCRIHHEAKLGKLVIKKLCDLEPLNVENFVLLPNRYADNAKADIFEEMREKVIDVGLKPKKAYSWIEFRNKVHVFGTGDTSHPRSEEIYRELDCLMQRVEETESHREVSVLRLHSVEEERDCAHIEHSELLALSFGLITTQAGATIRIAKNLWICHRCHDAAKCISKIVEREIIIKDPNRFHHFKDGICSCRDFW